MIEISALYKYQNRSPLKPQTLLVDMTDKGLGISNNEGGVADKVCVPGVGRVDGQAESVQS